MAGAWLSRLMRDARKAKDYPTGDQDQGRSAGFAEAPLVLPPLVLPPASDDDDFPERVPYSSHDRRVAHGVGLAPHRAGPLSADSIGANMPSTNGPFASTGPEGHRGRMREKLLLRGPDALADYELLEMLLFFAFKKGDTKPLAKALINRFGSFAAVLAAPQRELMAARGLGTHSVAALKLVQAAALRLARAEVMEQPILNNWDRLMDYLNAVLARERIEQFRVLFMDPRNRLIADEAQARGTVNHTPVYPREVVKRALELHATALVLVHNHPSGDPSPSRDDIEMTREVREAGRLMSIVLHDHIIVGNGRWLSFRREGLLD